MARSVRPWFCARTDWKVWSNGKKVSLAKCRFDLKAAKDALFELQAVARFNPSPDAPDQTVVCAQPTGYDRSSRTRTNVGTAARPGRSTPDRGA